MKMDKIFSDILKKRGSDIFLIDSINDARFTYEQFHQLACALAYKMRSCGVVSGDRVGILLPNCLEFAVSYFACFCSGAIAVPINPNAAEKEITFVVTNCKPKLLIYSPSLQIKINTFEAKSRLCLLPKHEAKGVDANADAIDLFSLPAVADFPCFENYSDDMIAVITYTSGTTARPKGVAHRMKGFIRNARSFINMTGIGPDTRFYHTFPMGYMAGVYNLLLVPFLSGGSVIISPTFNARTPLTFWETPAKYEANALWFNPTMIALLLKMDRGETGKEFCRSGVKFAFTGTAPLSSRIKEEFESRYGIQLLDNYGLSETLFVTANSPQVYCQKGSVGRVLPGMELKAVDEEGHPCTSGKEGEICVRTPDLMAGYLDDKGDILFHSAGDWFTTGDFGFLNKTGDLFITGRKKDIIIRGGINVSPKAIEEELLYHESIDEVSVIGIPHELYGEDIVAVIKLKPGHDFDSVKESLILFAQKNLASHQQPAFYLTIDEFSRSATGKIQKHQLREMVVNRLPLRTSKG